MVVRRDVVVVRQDVGVISQDVVVVRQEVRSDGEPASAAGTARE